MADQMPGRIVPIREHAQRRSLAGEVHARPYEVIAAPVRASHLALVHGDAAAEREHLKKLLAPHAAEPPGEGVTWFSRDLGALKLRWERHVEFSTYTFLRFDGFDLPFANTALELVPQDWLRGVPGELLNAMHIAVDAAGREGDELAALFDGNPLVGSKVVGGAGEVWTDFRLHSDGCGRVLMRDLGLSRGQTGRLLQRLFEIETYRMMALLAFPVARAAAAEIHRLDRELGSIVGELADPGADRHDRELLDRLTGLAAAAEGLDADTSFRLAAARAYYAIVEQRIEELRETRIPGTQTVAEFMDRRLVPAMKTCESTAERQQLLARRVSRAGDLLRTRVDIALEEKNRDLLKSMNRRAHIQLRLQETVEGLSVVAISYYLLGLLGYAAKGAKAAGAPIDTDVAVLAGLPVVVALVWLGVKRLRKALVHGGE
jgi:uncharacterized membrane-anchored protein